ncbi:hypothetical protein ACFLZL_05660, partial [Thermodesulfobacteriota bacterium]
RTNFADDSIRTEKLNRHRQGGTVWLDEVSSLCTNCEIQRYVIHYETGVLSQHDSLGLIRNMKPCEP